MRSFKVAQQVTSLGVELHFSWNFLCSSCMARTFLILQGRPAASLLVPSLAFLADFRLLYVLSPHLPHQFVSVRSTTLFRSIFVVFHANRRHLIANAKVTTRVCGVATSETVSTLLAKQIFCSNRQKITWKMWNLEMQRTVCIKYRFYNQPKLFFLLFHFGARAHRHTSQLSTSNWHLDFEREWCLFFFIM